MQRFGERDLVSHIQSAMNEIDKPVSGFVMGQLILITMHDGTVSIMWLSVNADGSSSRCDNGIIWLATPYTDITTANNDVPSMVPIYVSTLMFSWKKATFIHMLRTSCRCEIAVIAKYVWFIFFLHCVFSLRESWVPLPYHSYLKWTTLLAQPCFPLSPDTPPSSHLSPYPHSNSSKGADNYLNLCYLIMYLWLWKERTEPLLPIKWAIP